MPSTRRVALLIGAIVALDQITKSWAVSALDNGRDIHVVWTLQFSLGFNSGFAFSQGQGLGPYIGVVAVVAIGFLLRSMVTAQSSWLKYGLAAIVAGAVGNVVDRVFRGDGWLHGKVVDFIDLQWFPVFNVADSSITLGACLMLFGVWKEFIDQKKVAPEPQ